MSTLQSTAAQSFVRVNVCARRLGVSVQTIRNYADRPQNAVETRRSPGGHRYVNLAQIAECFGVSIDTESDASPQEGGRVVLAYARVSTTKQRADGNLARQVERLRAFCEERYPGQTVKVISEVGSGLSDTRAGFLRLVEMLSAGKISALVCEYRDRIARFGVGVVQRLCEAHGTEFVESRTGDAEVKEENDTVEMAKDLLAITAVYANRAAGARGAAKVKIVFPEGFRERVAQLAGAGLSLRDITKQIAAEPWVCQNTAKRLGERACRKVWEELRANGPVIPQSVKTFLKKRCVIGAGKRERTQALYDAYCQETGDAALTRDKFTDFIKRSVPSLRLDNCGVTTAYGLGLKAGRPA